MLMRSTLLLNTRADTAVRIYNRSRGSRNPGGLLSPCQYLVRGALFARLKARTTFSSNLIAGSIGLSI